MEKVRLIIMIGLPASGKSTYCEQQHKNGWVVNSSDAIREELYGTEDIQSHNDVIFNTMLRRTFAALGANTNCIYDATNLTSKRRINLIKQIRQKFPDVSIEAMVMATPYEECLKRNAARSRVVPEKVIASMLKRFEMPCYDEDFDKIWVSGVNQEYSDKALDLMNKAIVTPHDNPHHSLSIGNHMRQAHILYEIKEKDIDVAVSQALLWHDIGKIYCKTFVNARGETTDIAHYYGHECASAYLYLTLLSTTDLEGKLSPFDALVIQLIQHHMDFFKGERYLEKIKSRYNKDFWDRLEMVHKYDLMGH